MTQNHPYQNGVTRSVAECDSPQVHPQETSQPISDGLKYRTFLISGIRQKVKAVEQVYTAIDERDGKKRTQVYNTCRTSAWFVRHMVTGKIKLASSRCNQRWCPLCIRTKKFVMRSSLLPWVKRLRKPKFVTFTLKHSDAPLSHQIDSLYKYFNKLRRRPFWKKRIHSGVWFFQLTKSKADGRWHPHLHVICDGRFVAHSDLSNAWFDVTHGSNVVDIRAVKDPQKTADYVARYATAPCDLSSFDTDSAIEVFDALHGRRICGTFGNAKGLQLVPKKCPDADEWEKVATFTDVMLNRHHNDFLKTLYSCFIEGKSCPCIPPPSNESESWRIRKSFETESGYMVVGDEEPINYTQMNLEWSDFLN